MTDMDSLFQLDDGEDRLEMHSKPFLHTSRVLVADDEEEDDQVEVLQTNKKPPIDFELDEDNEDAERAFDFKKKQR
jgi:hypothetical protein